MPFFLSSEQQHFTLLTLLPEVIKPKQGNSGVKGSDGKKLKIKKFSVPEIRESFLLHVEVSV